VRDRRGRGARIVKRLLRPRIILPGVISLAIIGALLAFADVAKLADLIAGVQPGYLAAAVLLMLAYNAVRSAQWFYLLDHLGIVAPRREEALAYIGGALTKYLPGGSYFQNYLLYETSGVDPALSSVATTLIVFTEPVVALIFVLLIGVDDWVWLRWLIAIGLPLALLFAAGVYRLIESPAQPRWLTERHLYRVLADELVRFRDGLARMAHPSILATQAALAAVFVVLEGAALYMVALALHVDKLTVSSALAAYCFSVAVALVIPIFTDLGTLEAGGVAALIAMGVSRHGAVGVMVLDRALVIAVAIVLAVTFGLAWRDLLRPALAARS
jgi:glycosyltransferase 2 family protein